MMTHEIRSALDAAIDQIIRVSEDTRLALQTKPIFGRVFGSGEYVLASAVLRQMRLDRIFYMVLHRASQCPISICDNKCSALATARELLQSDGGMYVSQKLGVLQAKREEAHRLASLEAQATIRKAATAHKPKLIQRRRRSIFDASKGQCHYCETALVIDGQWHVEHKMPKALGGTNAPGNLVASCVSCNREKLDKTDLEYLHKRSQRAQALRMVA